MNLITHSLTPVIAVDGIRSLVGFGNPVRPLAHPELYLRRRLTRLYPNTFRGEQAITKFD